MENTSMKKTHRFQEMFVCKRKTKLIGKNQKIQYIQDYTVQTYQQYLQFAKQGEFRNDYIQR